MAAHDMFLAMILTNARREEARAIVLTVENATPQIHMLLLDGSTRPLTPPPAEILIKIIESLEQGQTDFRSSVFAVAIETVDVQRGPTGMTASISSWTIEHN
jgi:hypothetical protein